MSRHLTPKRIAATLVFITTTLGSVCLYRVTEVLMDSTQPLPVERRAASVVVPREEPQQLIDIFTGEDTLYYNGYEIRRLTEKVSYGHKMRSWSLTQLS